MRNLWRPPYCSIESVQNKLVVSALFDGGDILHSLNHGAAQKSHKKGNPWSFGMRFGNHIDVHATQSLPSGPV